MYLFYNIHFKTKSDIFFLTCTLITFFVQSLKCTETFYLFLHENMKDIPQTQDTLLKLQNFQHCKKRLNLPRNKKLPVSFEILSYLVYITLVMTEKVFVGSRLEIVMNELRRFKLSADFLANSSYIIESAIISVSYVSTPLTHLHLKTFT